MAIPPPPRADNVEVGRFARQPGRWLGLSSCPRMDDSSMPIADYLYALAGKRKTSACFVDAGVKLTR